MDRLYVPYGPDLLNNQTSGVWAGYGYGMSAVDAVAYDPIEKYAYVKSGWADYVTVVDYSSAKGTITEYSLDLTSYTSGLNDIAICPEPGYVVVSLGDKNEILVYETIKRSSPGIPKLVNTLQGGPLTDMLAVSPDCSYLGVMNAVDGGNPGIYLYTNFWSPSNTVTKVVDFAIPMFTDSYLESRNAYLPLNADALVYWSNYSNLAGQLNWTKYIDNWLPGMLFDPNSIMWSSDGKTMYMSTKSTNVVVRIDLETATAAAADGLAFKSFTSGEGVDLVQDGGCPLFVTNPYLYSTRQFEETTVVSVDGQDYLIGTDRGDDYGLDAFDEMITASDLFNGTQLGLKGFTAISPDLFGSSTAASNPFNKNCDRSTEQFCSPTMEFSVRSGAVDYSNPKNPVLQKLLMNGGRGLSAWKIPTSYEETISLAWETGSDFEVQGCKSVPWAHNAFVDETYASVGSTFYQLSPGDRSAIQYNNNPNEGGCANSGNGGEAGACPLPHTIDMVSPQESGMTPYSVVAGVACDRLFILGTADTNQDAFLYDVSDFSNPTLIQVLNLSPASQTKSPGVAYSDGTLGDVNPEHTHFLNASESPTGNPGILIGGTLSGTLSFYEIQCTQGSSGSGVSNLSAGAKAGISIGVIAGVLILVFVAFSLCRPKSGKSGKSAGEHTETDMNEEGPRDSAPSMI